MVQSGSDVPKDRPARYDRSARSPGHRLRIVFKFREHIRLPHDLDLRRHLAGRNAESLAAILGRNPGLVIRRYFTALDPLALDELTAHGEAMDPTYRAPRLTNWFVAEPPPGADVELLVNELRAHPAIETAYREPRPTPPPLVEPDDDLRWPDQGYLDPAPDGVDAEYAWNFPGGDGEGQSFVDLEQGWTLNHEDLVDHGIAIISGLSTAFFAHGTNVLGVVAAVDNDVGCVGITPNLSSVRVVSEWRDEVTSNVGDAVLSALTEMTFGDVLLLETQESGDDAGAIGFGLVPSEAIPAYFDTIRLATALGIVVVEAAGNGDNDLDTFENGDGLQTLNRNSADFRESGAILVGAATSDAPHSPNGGNYGSRVDCYAWGENINTTGTSSNSPQAYTESFNGTSGASAIIAGTTLAVQGLLEANHGFRYGPFQMRALLSDPELGTPSADPPADRIGVMPNLRAIIEGGHLNLAPDVYLRDFVGDVGDPHDGPIASSPDVILRTTPVADPEAAFGEGSGTENDNTLGSQADPSQDNAVYLRLHNRGVMDASNVEASVYWSPVATLVTPDLWTLVGTTIVPSVPSGDVLVVSDAITWAQDEIPAPGHYCFVALIGTDLDPAPNPTDFFDWATYRSFIRNNNNVTWRNFNVVDSAPAPGGDPEGFVALPFLVPGAPDRARRMALEIVSRLPAGARAFLEMPRSWLTRVSLRRSRGSDVPPGDPVRVPITPQGRELFGPLALPAKSRTQIRLLVQIPEARRDKSYQVYARQLFEGEEVGRVTWRLTTTRKDTG